MGTRRISDGPDREDQGADKEDTPSDGPFGELEKETFDHSFSSSSLSPKPWGGLMRIFSM